MANLAEVKMFLEALRSQDTSVYEGCTVNDSAVPIMTEVFMNGNCGNLAVMLALAFSATPVLLIDRYHVLSEIEGRMFDINGDVTDKYASFPKEHITLAQLMQTDMLNNYSWEARGPLL